jgi:hypothetical protein
LLLLPTPQVPAMCPDKAVNTPKTQPCCKACFRCLLFSVISHGQDSCHLGSQRQSNLSGQTDSQPNVSISTADTPGGTRACHHRHTSAAARCSERQQTTTDAHHTYTPHTQPNMHALQQHLFPSQRTSLPNSSPLLITTIPSTLDQTNHSS